MNTRTSFDRDQVGLLELLASNGVRAILRNVLGDEPALVDVTRLGRDDGFLGRLAGDCAEEHGRLTSTLNETRRVATSSRQVDPKTEFMPNLDAS